MDSRATRFVSLVCAALAVAFLAGTLLGCGGSSKSTSLRVGAPVTVDKPVSIATLSEAPETFAGQTVRLEGTVKAVCQGMGCWVEVEDAKGASFLARSLDDTILLPKDCAGRKVVVQGVVTAMPQETHEEPADATGHVCPKPEYVVATTGAVLR